MFYKSQDGHGLPHDPFTSLVAPRPIAWISTVNGHGVANLAPYSFFNAVCGKPPIIGFSSEGPKDTLNNIVETGEFVVNIVNASLANAMNLSSARLPAGEDEFLFAEVERAESQTVRPPRVAAAPAALECRLVSISDINTADGQATGNRYVMGQVTGIHIDDSYLVDGLFDVAKAGIIARLGYRNYARVSEVFTMIRPAEQAG